MPKRKPRLSRAMFLSLEGGIKHGSLTHGLSGRSAHGGWNGTRAALIRNGWIDKDWNVTDAGRAVYEAAALRHRSFAYDVGKLVDTPLRSR